MLLVSSWLLPFDAKMTYRGLLIETPQDLCKCLHDRDTHSCINRVEILLDQADERTVATRACCSAMAQCYHGKTYPPILQRPSAPESARRGLAWRGEATLGVGQMRWRDRQPGMSVALSGNAPCLNPVVKVKRTPVSSSRHHCASRYLLAAIVDSRACMRSAVHGHGCV